MSTKTLRNFSLENDRYYYAEWPGNGVPLLLVHGITASHMAWPRLVNALGGGRPILAPDLRGRGKNAELPGPYGFQQHVDDLVGLLDRCGLEKIVWIGHSLGAYIGLDFAYQHPERVLSLILVDGGIALPLRPGKTPEEVIKSILGPALARLDRRFENRESYHQFWKDHPAFQDPGAWNSDVEAYIDYDLGGEEPEMRSVVNPKAIEVDSYGPMEPSMVNRINEVTLPTLLLTAPRGLLNQKKPLLPIDAVLAAEKRNKHLTTAEIPDTNHYTILTGSGAIPVAEKIDGYLKQLNY